jgi:hypothetical protein
MLRRRLVPLAAGIALALGTPAVAQAATVNLVDERGDVHRLNADDTVQAVPSEARADILRTTIQHTNQSVVVRTRLRDVRRAATVGMAMRLRTSDGTYREVSLEASRRIGWRGQAILTRRGGQVVDCAVAHEISYGTAVMSVRVPRSCLNDPRWIQATVISLVAGRQILIDNPHNHRAGFNVWTPRIRRG